MAANFFKKVPRTPYKFNVDGVVESHDMTNISIKYILSYQNAKKTSNIYKFAWVNDLRPDSFADKYYGTDELYWLGLFSGGIYDIHNELPKNDNQLLKYMFLKYRYTQEYITFCDTKTPPLQKDDEETFYLYAATTIHHHRDIDGDIVDSTTPGAIPVSILEYEQEENEKKRYVNIIDSSFSSRLRSEYDSAMNKLQAELKNAK
jgi:hypothetical protein